LANITIYLTYIMDRCIYLAMDFLLLP
jgi:hypothetical protein